ncbi:PAP2 superfamily protein [Pseudorhodoplanes sinuspersici]|nr:PAP2 superfamily protein [Pseudorhodoplanes sinuspersici]
MAPVVSLIRHSAHNLASRNPDAKSRRRITMATSGTVASAIVACALSMTTVAGPQALAHERLNAPVLRQEGWLVKSYSEIANPISSASLRNEFIELKAIVAKRSPEDIERFRWWTTGGPAYRWNEIILDEIQASFVTLPLAARHLALYHAALDDALAVASSYRMDKKRSDTELDAALKFAGKSSLATLSPSGHAAVSAAAAEVLGYLFPERAALFARKAEEATQARLLAGVEYPQEVAAGRKIGLEVAKLAIARGKADRSGTKWSGVVPEGQDKWKGSNPIAPLAGTWQTWVLTHGGEVRPSRPPAVDSDQMKEALNELKTFARSPKTNHRATYWEVHGGARAHTHWNEVARAKLLEAGMSGQTTARTLAALNIALADAGTACWDAKYTFWYIRPPQLDGELKPLFAPPNHPSYPAAHGCYSTAAATFLASVFQSDRDRLMALGNEAAEARVWAGIHYRFDVEAGREIGRKVAQKTVERAFISRTH